MVFWPYGYSSKSLTVLPDGSWRIVFGHAPGPFLQYLGPLDITLLLIPPLVTGLAVWLVWRRATRSGLAKVVMWGLGLGCLAYCSAPIWFIERIDVSFIGVLFLPAAVFLIISAIILSATKPITVAALDR